MSKPQPSITQPTTTLHLFSRDLRLDDNPALLQACQSERLLCVYCVDRRWFRAERYQTRAMGALRWQFLRQSLEALQQQLAKRGQTLLVVHGEPTQQLARLIQLYSVDQLSCGHTVGYDERHSLQQLKARFPRLHLCETDNYTLFDQQQLPFSITELPDSYSKFRRQVEQLSVNTPLAAPDLLPPPPPLLQSQDKLPSLSPGFDQHSDFNGGESAAWQHMQHYFASNAPGHYKATRNALDGWQNSSKFSPWLNSGCLSVRRLLATLQQYEARHGANDSTQWLYVELLWREYFQWLALKQGVSLFRFRGLRNQPPLTSFYPEQFTRWCQGTTPWPLVNACMNELRRTGYLSNRGRQIVASALVNELQLDWRYGAAWFEQQLVDYDVAVNWGNWQYIAGVGVDPRGGRHFNLDKQTSQFDPDGTYRKHWAGNSTPAPLYSRDASDWPVLPGKHSPTPRQ
ncbi:MAG: DASH family cryptochrome [Marinobacterium sp.]|nr:DASH family cryptochrome [Marinobacterium sp.]